MNVEVAERAHSHVRRNLLVVLACTVLLFVLAIAALKLTSDFAKDTSESIVPKQTRDEIKAADCAALARLEAQFAPGINSEIATSRALRLVKDRQQELHCPASD